MTSLNNDIKIMKRCIELASNGQFVTSPNPMVGCVIMHGDAIIGEGYHKKAGSVHAEVNAIESVQDKSLLSKARLYVNLEPCSHTGKTPPCTDLIIKYKIPEAIIGNIDNNPEVSGKGIEKLKNAGCKVSTGINEAECYKLNNKFFTYHKFKRPYIILKWAETPDGFIDIERNDNSPKQPTWITNETSRSIVHKWRSEVDAIMIGTQTALLDNPTLTTRRWEGANPVRIILDKTLRLPNNLNIFNDDAETIIVNEIKSIKSKNIEFFKINYKHLQQDILCMLFEKNILSVLIEGGEKLITSYLKEGLWDEIRMFIGTKSFKKGKKAPEIDIQPVSNESIGDCRLIVYKNRNNPYNF